TYAYLIFAAVPSGLLLIYALRRRALRWAENAPLHLLLVGACVGYIAWLAERCVLIAIALGAYAAVQWWRRTKYGDWQPLQRVVGSNRVFRPHIWASLRSATWLVLLILISAGLLLAFDLFRFGTLLPSATSHAKGQTEVFYWPW